MIKEEEVKHIAKLARLGLEKEDIRKMEKELSKILDYIGKLKEVDVSGVEPMSHSVDVENVTSEDKEKPLGDKGAISKKLLELMPERKEGYLKTKKVL